MSKTACKVLVVDDEEDILLAGKLLLKQHFAVVKTTSDPYQIPALMQEHGFDVVLLDMNYSTGATSSKEGFHWLKQIQQLSPKTTVILMTAYGDIEMAVRALKEGATDFVLKPWQNEKLVAVLKTACQHGSASVKRSAEAAEQNNTAYHYDGFIGVSPAMQRVYQTIDKVAGTDANVLILGENGTGKEVAARALHRKSKRAGNVFEKVDLGAVSETLFESELFGHAKGSFTDAKEDRAGRLEAATGGSLFLDELGNLSLALQAKLLTVLQSRQVIRLGTNKPRPIDIRLICATNMPLYQMVREGSFRQDLLYRINTVEINLPPLRERREDIKLLAEHFLQVYRQKYDRAGLKLNADTMQRLSAYRWPGNIRELDHAMERAVILCDGNTLSPDDFYFAPDEDREQQRQESQGIADADYTLDTLEKMMVQKALVKHSGNITHAAKDLGITRTALYRRIEKHGL
ncbi:sigma-54-dependent transcriptional regulator [Pontibacter akesuensis]|uniref:DNA-binding transcriptional response regulator, NtrC family, contains REC, AAA-type ATPase, and a Fis-type DNA-binding domains n=1 Tax=Pontibacter akesuensis TaxID=388950 RepID=A0A1I7H0Y4_9BACT|nr:sigma-54 dependent transcriptional regulator [Pontibacter akesuensis]GHA54066.1 sigma-54-dependent Fis family transcriptional regulator [Pontibacter akesuensis]SFU54381.1 DNA-binding transcriptional response regulator, NtrC family, contains REC, AAA-type ATPase, and a Fis-type DNA-binding domains [Pontibacter akesuensis]